MKLCLLAPLAVVVGLISLPALTGELVLPEHARLLGNRVLELDSFSLAVGAHVAGKIPLRGFEGTVRRQSWRLNDATATTLQVLAQLRAQLLADGYQIVFACADRACGGFDFRFAIEVIPAPDMHVNIRDYRYLAALRGEHEALSLLVSQRGGSIYVQAIHVAPRAAGPPERTTPAWGLPDNPQASSAPPVQSGELVGRLQTKGHVALGDLVFETGSARLGQGPFASLKQLADYLKQNPELRIALVGHTDSVGSLDSNISLSKRRAGSVRTRMTEVYAIAPARIEAEGMGYLAPVASNLTREGREANRRVEAILLSR